MPKNLFPPYLNQGSQGSAVDTLHQILFMVGIGVELGIERDEDYGPKTAEGVRNLQVKLGCEPDGNFGPATRAALKAKMGLDVDAIPGSNLVFTKTDWVGPKTPEDKIETWDPDEN